jgi:hypothetical protein
MPPVEASPVVAAGRWRAGDRAVSGVMASWAALRDDPAGRGAVDPGIDDFEAMDFGAVGSTQWARRSGLRRTAYEHNGHLESR